MDTWNNPNSAPNGQQGNGNVYPSANSPAPPPNYNTYNTVNAPGGYGTTPVPSSSGYVGSYVQPAQGLNGLYPPSHSQPPMQQQTYNYNGYGQPLPIPHQQQTVPQIYGQSQQPLPQPQIYSAPQTVPPSQPQYLPPPNTYPQQQSVPQSIYMVGPSRGTPMPPNSYATGLNNPQMYGATAGNGSTPNLNAGYAAPSSSSARPTGNTTGTGYTMPTPAPVPAPTPAPTLNWQVCEAVFNAAVGKDTTVSIHQGEGRVGMGPEAMGCLMKTKDLSLVFTVPALAAVREELVHTATQGQGLLAEQRLLRHVYVKQFLRTAKEAAVRDPSHLFNVQPVGSTQVNPFLSLTNKAQKTRTRKNGYKELRYWEKEERSVRESQRRDRKQKMGDFFKKLLGHQEAFVKYHSTARSEMSKLCKSIRTNHEAQLNRAKKEEMRLELQRLQALRSGEMASYVQLVAHTKNDRLQFLIDQTDRYLQSINQLIQDQRENEMKAEAEAEKARKAAEAESAGVGEGSSAETAIGAAESAETPAAVPTGDDDALINQKLTQASKDYYRSTHRLTEAVVQPRMVTGGQLKDYQLVALQWMVSLYNNHLNGILADEMGLGKTVQTIALLSYVVEVKKKHGPFLVVVPLSTLSNWVNEFARWTPTMFAVEYKGPKNLRKDIRKNHLLNKQRPFNVLLTTYEYVIRDKSHLKRFPWEYIVVDEGHRMKNSDGLLARILGCDYHSRNRLLLTGTPLQNNLPELWSLLNFLLPTIFSSAETFDDWFNKPFNQFKQAGRPSAASLRDEQSEANKLTQEEQLLIVQRLHEVLRPFVLRRLKSQVLDQLPDKVESVIRCPLSGWQRKMYQSVLSKGLYNGQGANSTGGGLSNTLMQLRKVCNHPYLFLQSYTIDDQLIAMAGKFELLDRMLPKLKAAGHRVLIFSQMVETLKVLQDYMRYRGYLSLMLSGDVASEDREQSIAVFNAEDSPYFVFLLSTKAGGLGVNLATADTVIIFDSDWNPSGDDQAQGRAHRIGQRNKVSVFRLLTNNSVEEKVLAIAEEKRHLTGLVVEAGGFSAAAGASADQSSASANRELMELLLQELRSSGANTGAANTASVDGEEVENTAGDNDFDRVAESEILDDDELNEILATYEGEFELYKSIDEQRALGRPLARSTDVPLWMSEASWLPKYRVLMQDMLCTDNGRAAAEAREREIEEDSGRLRKRDASKVYVDEFFFPEELVSSSSSESESETSVVAPRRALTINESTGMLTLRLSAAPSSSAKAKPTPRRKSVASASTATTPTPGSVKRKAAPSTATAKTPKTPKTVASTTGDDEGKTPGKRGRKSALSLLPPCAQALGNALQAVTKLDIATLFREKPPMKIYPDYYRIVPQPLSLKEIAAKLKACEYQFFEQIEMDFALMSHNARLFNTEQSFVFDYVEKVRRDFYRRARQILIDFEVRPLNRAVFEADGEEDQAIPPLPADSHNVYSSEQWPHFTGILPQALFTSSPTMSAKKARPTEDF